MVAGSCCSTTHGPVNDSLIEECQGVIGSRSTWERNPCRILGIIWKSARHCQWQGGVTLAIRDDSQAPAKPETPEGETNGKINKEYTYTSSTTDPETDKVYYFFDWDDGEVSGWVGPYNSGETGEASHTWIEQGDYEIRVKAKDEHGVQSEWSDPLPISMPKSKGLFNGLMYEIFELLMERFPLLEQLILSRPIISQIINI